MYKDWPNIATEMIALTKQMRAADGTPEVMKAFSAMAQAATAPKALDTKTKELIALGIAVAVRCDPCITFHTESARKHGATREEIMETVGMAIYMGAGPSVMYAAQAVEAYDQYVAKAGEKKA
jgi:alkylhydroperoxidase AhpD family core domain